MAFMPSDKLVSERIGKYVAPGENLYVQTMGWEQPGWGWILLVGSIASFFYKYYCLGVKEAGLIVTEVSMWGYGEKSTAVIPWNMIFHVNYEKGMIQDIMTFQTGDGRQWKIRFQNWMGMKTNRDNAATLAQYVATWSQAVQQQQV